MTVDPIVALLTVFVTVFWFMAATFPGLPRWAVAMFCLVGSAFGLPLLFRLWIALVLG